MRNLKLVVLIGIFLTTLTVCGQTQNRKGYPEQGDVRNLKEAFAKPPKGYGNVPFYWWNGDSLKEERLRDQLDILSDAAIDGLSVSYIHTHPQIDTDINAHGYGSFGRADPGAPEVFGKDWWQVWNNFAGVCADKGIGIGVDDYVLGWAGNGLYVDELLGDLSFRGYQGKLKLIQSLGVDNTQELPKTVVSDHTYNNIRYVVYTEPDYVLHPEYGKRLVEVYFNRFEKNMDVRGRSSLNYFFQDELQYPLTLQSWCEDMPEQFLQRKGYDVIPYLAALFTDIGEITAKVRLDYAEVLTQLAEERYFKPVFDWHNQRGLLYGCDNTGRGLEPLQYLDYFRASSWYTAPGNDAPARGSSFLPTKVSSSVTHLYNRPRTWLEAFHSMGWNSNGEWLTSQLDHHLIAGGNLLCMHGLYYSTHGGWWEWAPPCFHFRMPYWPHMKHWLRYAERMCYLLSQGTHVCDIAVMYPTETLHADPKADISPLWKLAQQMSDCGLDYDFIDYQSLQRASISDGRLIAGNETYRILVLVGMKAMHEETAAQIRAFQQQGGIVISTGGQFAQYETIDDVLTAIRKAQTPDFSTDQGEGKVLHRKIGDKDLYMIMNVRPSSRMFFRCKGKVERWNAWDGSTVPQPVEEQTEAGTTIMFDGEYNKSWLLMFCEGEPVKAEAGQAKPCISDTIPITGSWTTELVPTMDNRWGDFRLPATNEIIGAEARETDQGLIGFAPYLLTKQEEEAEWQPYPYSWQYGVQDSPGSQGYHGMKGKVDSRFIILDKGGSQRFTTSVYADMQDNYQVIVEGVEPDTLWVDGRILTGQTLSMKKGWHRVEWVYGDTRKADYSLDKMAGNYLDTRDRSAVVFYHASAKSPSTTSAYGLVNAMKWYGTAHLEYDPNAGAGTQTYRFKTAPGARQLTFTVKGRVLGAAIDGKALNRRQTRQDGNGRVVVTIDHPNRGFSEVALTIKPSEGTPASASLTSPVSMECGKGEMTCGDWSQQGALKYYSGGVRYQKTITLSDINNSQTLLCLGKVDATCEVSVNGCEPQILIDPPYQLDITPYIKDGENTIEVLVYSTLSNHYQTIPSPYRGKPYAGLIGPVAIVRRHR